MEDNLNNDDLFCILMEGGLHGSRNTGGVLKRKSEQKHKSFRLMKNESKQNSMSLMTNERKQNLILSRKSKRKQNSFHLMKSNLKQNTFVEDRA